MEYDWPTYTVRLVSAGHDRLSAMKVIRALRPGLALQEAKALVDGAPQVVATDVRHFDVDVVRHRFVEVGAVVEFTDNTFGRKS
jgi:ribosomal protein L7/L12